MRAAEEMELDGKEVKEAVDFDQLVRIFVDTDADTHFIVSLGRTSTVAELRGEVFLFGFWVVGLRWWIWRCEVGFAIGVFFLASCRV
jgi:hypothetical protein